MSLSPRRKRRQLLNSMILLGFMGFLGFFVTMNVMLTFQMQTKYNNNNVLPFFTESLSTSTSSHHEDQQQHAPDGASEQQQQQQHMPLDKLMVELERQVASRIKVDPNKVRSCHGGRASTHNAMNDQGDSINEMQRLCSATTVRSCQRHSKMSLGGKATTEWVCEGRAQSTIVYNPSTIHARIYCGDTIEPLGLVIMNETCLEPHHHVFPTEPTANDDASMPPIHVVPVGDFDVLMEDGSSNGSVECDKPCMRPGVSGVFNYYQITGMKDIDIVYSMESSQNYPELELDRLAWRSGHYYATTSFQSEIPLPYFSFAEYNITEPPVEYSQSIRGASFLAANCDSRNHREEVVQELMTYMRVDSLGQCLHNANHPAGYSIAEPKKKLIRAYLFHLSFENSQQVDYITEKLWGALEAGTLPVYYGAPNVKEHVPPNSIISWHDFASTKDLAKYLNKVASNQKLYESYHEWRSKPLPESFLRKYNFTRTHSICRICRWAYAKKYGLGWNHESQTVRDTIMSRHVSFDKDDRVIHPFRESWILQAGHHGEDAVGGWTRKVWQHDGVIDIHFEAQHGTRKKSVFRIDTDLRGRYRSYEPLVMFLENDVSRITILTSWDAQPRNSNPGVVDLTLDPSSALIRVRVIAEDLDKFHLYADTAVNYFGDFMTNDFFSPVEVFLIEGSHLKDFKQNVLAN